MIFMTRVATPEISVVIPTLGRPSLKKVIDQILDDKANLDVEIVVVADGLKAFQNIMNLHIPRKEIRIILNTQSKGVSGSLNAGLESARGEYVMFFSDDDYWIAGKFNTALIQIRNSDENTCICFQTISKNHRGKKVIRPTNVPKEPINPINYCYGSSPFINNDRYISLTSFIAPQSVRQVKFSEELHSREDIAWLHSLHENGFKIEVAPFVGAFVQIGYQRTMQRDSAQELTVWLEWLKRNSPENVSTFVFSHFLRPFAVTESIFKGIGILVKIKFWNTHPSMRSLLSFLFIILTGISILIRPTSFGNLFKRVTLLKFII